MLCTNLQKFKLSQGDCKLEINAHNQVVPRDLNSCQALCLHVLLQRQPSSAHYLNFPKSFSIQGRHADIHRPRAIYLKLYSKLLCAMKIAWCEGM